MLGVKKKIVNNPKISSLSLWMMPSSCSGIEREEVARQSSKFSFKHAELEALAR